MTDWFLLWPAVFFFSDFFNCSQGGERASAATDGALQVSCRCPKHTTFQKGAVEITHCQPDNYIEDDCQ